MSYKSKSGIGEAYDRVLVAFREKLVWSKSIEFYEKHMNDNHRLQEILDTYKFKQKA